MSTSLALSMVVSVWTFMETIPFRDLRQCIRLASNSGLSLERFRGWFHALRSGGSASNLRRTVLASSHKRSQHHRLSPSHWLVLNALASFLRGLTVNSFFFYRGSSNTVLSVACPGSASGLASATPRAVWCHRNLGHGRGATRGITLAAAPSAAVYSRGHHPQPLLRPHRHHRWSGSSCTTRPWSRCPPCPASLQWRVSRLRRFCP